MRNQVARSKGTEWMVSAYNTWQLRSPLENMPEKNQSTLMQLTSRIEQKANQLNGVFALSFKSILIILGIILAVKSK
jgi:hypothetical protein